MQIQGGETGLNSLDRMDVLSKDDGWHYPPLSDNVIMQEEVLSLLVLFLIRKITNASA
jgi:hypothetical protein